MLQAKCKRKRTTVQANPRDPFDLSNEAKEYLDSARKESWRTWEQLKAAVATDDVARIVETARRYVDQENEIVAEAVRIHKLTKPLY